MQIIDLINRPAVPTPWAEGEKIPWNEPGFSQRMLKEHLSQAHDHASRRFEIIDAQMRWVHETLLQGQPSRVLDLGCGPGLYSMRLAQLGHTCHGIDFGPASIAHAREQTLAQSLTCTFDLHDIRQADFGSGQNLAMLIYGEFNVFRREEAAAILRKVWQALDPGGWLLLEPHTYEAIRTYGQEPRSWYASKGGLFSPRPHLYLEQAFWHEELAVTTHRYDIIDAETGLVACYADSMPAYSDDEYRALLGDCGFVDVALHPGLTDDPAQAQPDLIGITARKPGR